MSALQVLEEDGKTTQTKKSKVFQKTDWIENSATRVSPVPVANPRMLDSGRCLAPGLTSRRLGTS